MQKILNFGSLNIDHVFTVDHFVQPGETMAALGLSLLPGGKGLNQSVALARAGAEVYHAGKVGANGTSLVSLLQKDGVHTEWIDRTGSTTGMAVIQVDRTGQNCILVSRGANGEMTGAQIDAVLSSFGRGDLLLLQNEVNLVSRMIDKAAARGMTIALNPSPIDESLGHGPLEKVSYFLLNELEGESLTGEKQPDRICEALLTRCPKAKIVLTLGKKGVLYRDQNARFAHGVYRVPVVDTTGAGDTFTGFFLASVIGGCSVEESLKLASAASSLAISRKGAADAIPTLQEVKNAHLEMQL
ncbi:MAG: ribokinase [Oscillospiraceae bacterium]|nr:ribokinase [Oscillospiraceae bacterium]